LVAQGHLGIPQSAADAFTLLERAGLVDAPLCRSMRGMVGFRNVAIHQYEELDHKVLEAIAATRFADWIAFCSALGVKIAPGRP